MIGYLKRNVSTGVKEIREGDVRPLWDLGRYDIRHSMSPLISAYYLQDKIAWEHARRIAIHPGLYWAFPEQEGKVEYLMWDGFAIPVGFNVALLAPKETYNSMAASRRFERMMFPIDGGYRNRRNSRDGGL